MASVAKRKWTHNGFTKEAWMVRYVDPRGSRRGKTFELKRMPTPFDGRSSARSRTAFMSWTPMPGR